jgi:hypothetical protein
MRVTHEATTPAECDRLRAAAEAARRVRPPGIVRVVSIAERDDGGLVVVTDEPDGPPIDQQPLESPAFAAAAAALDGLHRLGHVHGDVSAASVRRDVVGRAVLALPRWRDENRGTVESDRAALATLSSAVTAEVPALVRRSPPRYRTRRRRPSGTTTAGVASAVVGVALVAVSLHTPSSARPTVSAPVTVPATGDRVVEVDGRRYEIGVDGDRVVVGAWGCAETATPAVIRPATGEVFVFDGYRAGAVATPVTRVDGITGAGRTADRRGCDRLVLATVNGPVEIAAERPPRSPAGAPAP